MPLPDRACAICAAGRGRGWGGGGGDAGGAALAAARRHAGAGLREPARAGLLPRHRAARLRGAVQRQPARGDRRGILCRPDALRAPADRFRRDGAGGLERAAPRRLSGEAAGPAAAGAAARGYGVLFERIRAQLEAAGGRVVLQAPVTRIEREASGRMVVTSPAGRFRVATVVGAAPLDTLHRAVFGTESGFESLSLMTLFVSAGRFAPGAGTLLFNFHGAGRWKRATFYSRIYPDPAITREYFSVEATLLPGEALSPETVFAEFAAQCLRLGLAEDLRLEGAVTTPQAYPLYRPGQLARRAAVLERLVQGGAAGRAAGAVRISAHRERRRAAGAGRADPRGARPRGSRRSAVTALRHR
ncbi:FAD-dependent oxidoreductase [Rhodobacter capsulatus]|uniref:FAD-dependent oxidoreductase n=1 Tax=Rhodobacter capsulatus TaxID=1061 RepID=UPI004029F7DF